MAEVLAIFTDADARIKDIEIGDHEFKIVHFANEITIFIRYFSCLFKIELILEFCEEASS